MQIGIDKIGFGTTRTKNGVTEYTQYYIRTIPTVSVVLLVILAPELSQKLQPLQVLWVPLSDFNNIYRII